MPNERAESARSYSHRRITQPRRPGQQSFVVASVASQIGFVPEKRLEELRVSRRERIGNADEIVGVAVGPKAPIEEEAAIGAYDVALMEANVVHHHVRCHAFDLHGRGWFFLDPLMLLGARGKSRLEDCDQQ